MKVWHLSFLLLLTLVVGGCNLAPKYDRPKTDTPIAFKETNGWRVAQPNDAVLKGKWWELFNDPQLNALEERVAISNQTVVAAFYNFMAARAIVKQARAAYYPTVVADPSVTRTRPPRSGNSTLFNGNSGGNNQPFNTYTLEADASWEPDLWGSVRNTVAQDAYAAQASAATLENLKLSEQANLAVYYYDLRGQDELIRVYSDNVKAYDESVSLTKTLYETGIDSELDEAQAIALRDTVIAEANALAIQRAQYEHAIALLIGLPASAFVLPPTTDVITAPVIPIGVPSELLERRPDIAISERNVAAANAQIGVTRAAYYPALNLTGTVGYQSTSLSTLLQPESLFWSIGATLTETVIDFGKRRGLNEQAWANYRGTVANYRQTVLTAFQQVEDYLAALRILTSETSLQSSAVNASQRSLDLSMERYRLGVASYLNVITAQETLLNNQQTSVNIHTQQLTSTVDLILSLGGGWTNGALPNSKKLVLKDPELQGTNYTTK